MPAKKNDLKKTLKVAIEFLISNAMGRTLAALGGIALVRLLPASEYGLYTIILSGFMFLCTVTDLGATQSLAYFKRRLTTKRRSWRKYYEALILFRRSVFLVGAVFASSYVIHTSTRIGASLIEVLPAVIIAGIASWISIGNSITAFALRLEQKFRGANLVELSNELAKAGVIGTALLFSSGSLSVAVASILIGALVSKVTALRCTKLDVAAKIDKLDSAPSRRQQKYTSKAYFLLLEQVKPALPGSIYYSFQWLILIYLAARYGDINVVAEIGALGRISIIVLMISSYFVVIVIPKLAAVSSEVDFLRSYLQWWAALFALGGVGILLACLVPEYIILILGDGYSHLTSEVIIIVATAILSSWSGYAWNTLRLKGWTRFLPLSFAASVTGQVLMFWIGDFRSTYQILLFSLYTNMIGLVVQLAISVHGFTTSNAVKKS